MILVKRKIAFATNREQDLENAVLAAKDLSLEENLKNYCAAVKMNYAFMNIDVTKKILKRTIKYAE